MVLTTKPPEFLPTTTTTPTPHPHPKPQNNPQTQSHLEITKPLRRISLHPTLTPYRRRVYRTLLTIPCGRWTTYSALASYLGSSPRAVGNAMRTNPFAPEVPCHRVLAADGSLGGYKGAWTKGGKGEGCEREMEKRRVLEGEGIVFDTEGRAKGACFGGFGKLT